MKPFIFPTCLIVLMISACSKDNNQHHSFGWTQDGTVFYYDKYAATDTVKDYLTLQVVNNRFFQNNASTTIYMRLDDRTFAVKEDGLYSYSCVKCGVATEWFDCNDKFTYLFAPANATANQQIPLYGCGKNAFGIHQILNSDTLITVPKGTYHTYIMQLENGDISYWNADSGIIRYDKLNAPGTSDGQEVFVLSRTQ